MKATVAVHNPGYTFDDKVLPVGASMFARMHRNPSAGVPPMHAEQARKRGKPSRRCTTCPPSTCSRAIAPNNSCALGSAGGRTGPCREVEPHLKALYAFDPDGARVQQNSTRRWQNGAPAGTLDGVPVTIKDNIATKGDAGAAWAPPPTN